MCSIGPLNVIQRDQQGETSQSPYILKALLRLLFWPIRLFFKEVL
jgi:hypothetical protein